MLLWKFVADLHKGLHYKIAVLFQEIKTNYWSILTESRVAIFILRMTRQTRAAVTHWDESTTQEQRYEKISHRLFCQNHASKIHSPRLEPNVVFHFLAVSKAKTCLYAMDGDFCCLCNRGAGEGRFTRSLWNPILMGRPQRKKKMQPFSRTHDVTTN